MSNQKRSINPLVKDVWHIVRTAEGIYGLNLGLNQFIYYIFLYGKFGSNSWALHRAVFILLTMQLGCFLFEVPTGALGDYIGRKKTVVLCFFTAALGFLFRAGICFFSTPNSSFTLAVIATSISALSYTLLSGSFTSWIVDTVKERNISDGYGAIFARGSSIMLFMKIVGAMIGMFLFLNGYVVWVFVMSGVIAFFCAVYCGIKMKETESLRFYKGTLFLKHTVSRMKEIAKVGFKVIISTPPLLYLFFVGVSFTLLMHIVNALWPIAMKTNFGIERMTFYWFFLVFTGLVVAFSGAKFLEFLQHRNIKSSQTSLTPESLWLWTLRVSLVMGIPIVILGLLNWKGMMDFWTFAIGFICFNFGYGFLMPGLGILWNQYIPLERSQERATISSWDSMMSELFVLMLAFPSSGPTGEKTTIGWILPASMLIVSVLVVHVLLKCYWHGTEERRIVLTGEAI